MKQNKGKNIKHNNNLAKNKIPKKDKNNIKHKKSIKKTFIKFLIFVLIIALIVGICFISIRLINFKKLAKEMFNTSSSNIFDSNNNMIAQIGIERNRENVSFSTVPKQLVNAYISIEDERFYNHHGVDIKRTGAAIISYIIKRWLHFFWW